MSGSTRHFAVLVVDDDESMCEVHLRVLARLGYEARAVRSVAAAITVLEQDAYELVLSDLVMPDQDGIALVSIVKERFPDVDVILITGQGTMDHAVRSLRAGASDFLLKPIEPAALGRAIERCRSYQRAGANHALQHASLAIGATREPAELPRVIVETAMAVLDADSVALLVPGADGALYVAHAFGLGQEVERNVRIPLGTGVAGRVAESGTPAIIVGPAAADPRFEGVASTSKAKTSIVYPMHSSGSLVGVITFGRQSLRRLFRRSDLETVAVLASQITLALSNARLAQQSATAEKLAAVGALAAGIAHEINTPVQFVGDSVHFLNEAFEGLGRVLLAYRSIAREVTDGPGAAQAARLKEIEEENDLEYLLEEIPRAATRTQEGMARVAEIVRAMKQFSRRDEGDKSTVDINATIESALTLARNEYKYIAEVELQLGQVPTVLGHSGDIAHVFLNLIVNAAHAIAATGAGENGQRGTIRIASEEQGTHVVVSVEDTGSGIPSEIQSRVFEPFFTTKAVGKGTGLGLAIARATIVDHHGGTLTFQSEVGVGTKFTVRLPMQGGAVDGDAAE